MEIPTSPRPLTDTEVRLAFVASCIEGAAEKLGQDPQETYRRMERVGLISNYIVPCYDTLHTESREHVTDDVVQCLKNWEARL